MATWIFQGNPNTFDVDGYLEQADSTITWLVRQHANDIEVGDTVFLWRSEGDGKQPGGIIAELEVMEQVRNQPDDSASLSFWKGKVGANDGTAVAPRVRLRLLRLASKREVLKREWLKEDPVLKNLAPLKMAQHTNFAVNSNEVPRLRALWENTDRDWTRDESLAALYAYDKSFGGSISKLEGSLVSQIAQKIGRATTGVYNKLMNFRSLDPRAKQKGLEGSSAVDLDVWNEFFDASTNTMKSNTIAQEYSRLWRDAETPPLAESTRESVQAEAARLERRGLAELLKSFKTSNQRSDRPQRRVGTVTSFNRDPLVVAITRLRAGFRCEVPGCVNHHFVGSDGNPYIETHHLQMLSDGGIDDPINTVAVCAIHHRELHHGTGRVELKKRLLALRRGES